MILSIKNIFAISEHPRSLGNRFRNKRFNFFEARIKDLPKPLHILDIGGTPLFWENRNFHNRKEFRITLLNLSKVEAAHDNMISIAGNATRLSHHKDAEFDVVFSNSVIEHLHTWEDQVRMANEVMRVGKKFFIQTPNRHFFMEPHYLLPFFQYLPGRLKYFILTKTKLSRLKKWDKGFARQYIEEIRLLTRTEMKRLFPGAEIYYEKFLGMNKSFTVHNFS